MFWRHAIEIAAAIGRSRLTGKALLEGLILCVQTPRSAILPSLSGMIAGPVMMMVGLVNWKRSPGMRELTMAGWLLVSLPLYQNLVIVSTLNEPQNALPYIGLLVCLLIRSLRAIGRTRLRVAASIVMIIATGWIIFEGFEVDRCRIVQEFDCDATFESEIGVAGMEGVYWGEPTVIPANQGILTIHREDFVNTVRYLQRTPGNFFVAGDSNILYGLLGRKSPQPLLYFTPDHSYAAADIPRLDAAILGQLQANGIETVVKEQFTFMNTQPAYAVFPRTWSWLTQNFKPAAQFGIFEIWRRADP